MRRPTNDNDGPVLGADPHGDLFEKWRIADAAKHIQDDLETNLQDGSQYLGRILKRGEAYHKGLTNGETTLAVLTALSRLQLKFLAKHSSLNFGLDDEDDDDGEAA